jgi:uncharacterized protein YPO0396
MSAIKQWIADRQFNRILIVFFAGLMLFLNVACSAPDSPKVSGEGGSYSEKRGAETELYKTTQKKQDGINSYNDDVRDSSSRVQAKSRDLIQNSKRNIERDADDITDAGDKLRQSTQEFKSDLSQKTERQKDNFVEGTKDGMQNLNRNLNKASKEIPNVIQEATDNLKEGLNIDR